MGSFFLKDEEFYKSLFTTTQRSLTPEQKKAQLHLVIVANTEDETIGNSCMLDKDRNLKTFSDLSEFLGIGFDPQVIFGSSYNKDNVQKAIQALHRRPTISLFSITAAMGLVTRAQRGHFLILHCRTKVTKMP